MLHSVFNGGAFVHVKKRTAGCTFWNNMYIFKSVLTLPLSLWLIGTVRAEPETVISRAWV